jgi:ParB/RepB/Spo0J family partition protein
MSSALIVNRDKTDWRNQEVVLIPIENLQADPNQPRKTFQDNGIEMLSETIAAHNVIEPLLVLPIQHGKYTIIDGERRYRSAYKAGLTHVPCIIRSYSDSGTIKVIQLVQSFQNQALEPQERAAAIVEVMGNKSQKEIAKTLGISQSSVAQAVALMNLSDDVGILRSKKIVQDINSLLTIEKIKKQSPEKAQLLMQKIDSTGSVKRDEILEVWKSVAPPRKKKKIVNEGASQLDSVDGGTTKAINPSNSNDAHSSDQQKSRRIWKVRKKLNLPDLPLPELFDRLAQEFLLLTGESEL